MASEILSSGFRKVTGGAQDVKAAQLEEHTKDVSNDSRITSDYGVSDCLVSSR
jgi:hypothetical protein